MKVLYIDGDGPWGGASRSLFEAVNQLKLKKVEPHFIVTQGSASEQYKKLTTEVITTFGITRFDNTKYSHYRGFRWLIIFREIINLPFTISAILKARKKWSDIDLIHVNELTEIIPAIIAKKVFKVPVVIHSRSLFRYNEKSIRFRWIRKMVMRNVSSVISIDESVKSTLPSEFNIRVIHNSFTPKEADKPDVEFQKKIDSLDPIKFKLGFVGNLLYGKGLVELIEATKLIREKGVSLDVIIVGDSIRNIRGVKAFCLKLIGLSQNIKEELEQKIKEYNLEDSFHLMGSTFDIQPIYERFDVLCFPSHFDAPGRPIFEAAFSNKPSIAAINNPQRDTLIPFETGLSIPPKNIEKLAESILYCLKHPNEVSRMGNNARLLAEQNFTPSVNAKLLYDEYTTIIKKEAKIL